MGLADFPAAWTGRGLVFHLRPHRELPGVDPLDTTNPNAIVLRWHELRELAAVDPWPRFRVRWRGPGGGDDHTFAPARDVVLTLLMPALAPEPFAEQVGRLIEHTQRHAPHAVRRGWLDAPEVRWERVGSMPEVAGGARPELGHGAFRAIARPVEEMATAVRPPNRPLESMMQWLMSTPDRPWRQHPREVRLGPEHLYAARRDGTIWRVPLETLRARVGEPSEDALYVFGRRTSIVLTKRDACEVRAALDARLERAQP